MEEIRGKSWAIGGDPNTATLANFIKKYSPNLRGASVGSHFVEICADYFCPSAHIPSIDVFNAAQSGAWVQNLPDQVHWLVEQMQLDVGIDYENDWKVINILIGANNLCATCIDYLDSIDNAKQFELYFKETILELTRVPKSFINVVQLFNISQVYNITEPYTECRAVHDVFPIECSCLFWGTNSSNYVCKFIFNLINLILES